MKSKPAPKVNNQGNTGKQLSKNTLTIDSFTRLLALYKAQVYERCYPLD